MKNILILEDEPFLSNFLRLVLQGYFVVSTTTAENALCKFIEYNRRFDLLISDVTLPISSGVRVALILRSELPELKIILTSGYLLRMWSDQNSSDLQRLGEDSVTLLMKPFSIQTLLNTVDALIGPPDGSESV
jgi:two-component system, cell cycle sensor histidine kinase and response regulator CckA